jgi:hypothetical protein
MFWIQILPDSVRIIPYAFFFSCPLSQYFLHLCHIRLGYWFVSPGHHHFDYRLINGLHAVVSQKIILLRINAHWVVTCKIADFYPYPGDMDIDHA